MKFDFVPDMLMLRDMLRRFLQKDVFPLEMKFFRQGELEPVERARLRSSIQQMGLWGLTVPEIYGGGGLDLVTTCLIEAELGSTFIPLEIGDVPEMLYACAGEQISCYLEPTLAGERKPLIAIREPQALHPREWTTLATQSANGVENGFVLNGRKLIKAHPDEDDFFIVIAKSAGGFTAFLVDPDNSRISWLPASTGKQEMILELSDYKASAKMILGEPGGALMLVSDSTPQVRIRTGARYLGIIKRLLDMAVEHSKDWMVFGASISNRPAVRRMLAEIKADLESARWLVYHAAWLVDEGKLDQSRRAAAQVRLVTGEILRRTTDKVTMIFAGPGPLTEFEPCNLVYSTISPEALEMGLEKARAEITASLLEAL